MVRTGGSVRNFLADSDRRNFDPSRAIILAAMAAEVGFRLTGSSVWWEKDDSTNIPRGFIVGPSAVG